MEHHGFKQNYSVIDELIKHFVKKGNLEFIFKAIVTKNITILKYLNVETRSDKEFMFKCIEIN